MSSSCCRPSSNNAFPDARLNVDAARSGYVTGGKIAFLTLIEAERNLVLLRERYYEAVADSYRRLAILERVVGGPLEPAH